MYIYRKHRSMRKLLVVAGIFFGSVIAMAQQPLPYRDSSLPISARVADLLARMSPEEKFWQLFMLPGDLPVLANGSYDTSFYQHGLFGFQVSAAAQAEGANQQMLNYQTRETAVSLVDRVNSIQRYFVEHTRLGIPVIFFDEGLHGLVRNGATAFPQAIGLAATFDTSLMHSIAKAIAEEARLRGIRQLLSPVVNIASDVRWGRTEETYGEDPFLCSVMAVAFVSELEKAGIISTPKHFIANVGDGGRDSYPIHINERLLREIYLPPFLACLKDGGSRSVMTSYNSVDGSPATANDWLLNKLLKREWGFDGFVISDASAVGGANVLHYTASDYSSAGRNAIQNGLDVIFQTQYDHHKLFLPPFIDSSLSPARIDDAVSRVLRAKFQLGLFDHPYVTTLNNTDSALMVAHRKLSRSAAVKSIVLLQNKQQVLPIQNRVKTIAVIGVDADKPRLGGYSGPGNEVISILQGIRQRAGANRKVLFAQGPGRTSQDYIIIDSAHLFLDDKRAQRGLLAEYYDNINLAGTPYRTSVDKQVDFHWTLYGPDGKAGTQMYSSRWKGKLKAPHSGTFNIGLEGSDGFRLYLNGSMVIDNWQKQTYQSITIPFYFDSNKMYDIRVEFYETTGNGHVKLIWNAGINKQWKSSINEAVNAARQAGLAIIVTGITEGEFQDRAILSLPGHQEELIQRVAATGTPVVVVMTGGSAVTMQSWQQKVKGIVAAWYPGEQGGNAVADILFGDENPGGRLSITFPRHEGQLPLVYNHKPTGRGDDYVNLSGRPLFPFGFGLSYTKFSYQNFSLSAETIDMSDTLYVTCTIKNTGNMPGDEVVQLYLHDDLSSVARPVRELKGFHRVHLQPGEEKPVRFMIPPSGFEQYNENMVKLVEPGSWTIWIGSSSTEIKKSLSVTIK